MARKHSAVALRVHSAARGWDASWYDRAAYGVQLHHQVAVSRYLAAVAHHLQCPAPRVVVHPVSGEVHVVMVLCVPRASRIYRARAFRIDAGLPRGRGPRFHRGARGAQAWRRHSRVPFGRKGRSAQPAGAGVIGRRRVQGSGPRAGWVAWRALRSLPLRCRVQGHRPPALGLERGVTPRVRRGAWSLYTQALAFGTPMQPLAPLALRGVRDVTAGLTARGLLLGGPRTGHTSITEVGRLGMTRRPRPSDGWGVTRPGRRGWPRALAKTAALAWGAGVLSSKGRQHQTCTPDPLSRPQKVAMAPVETPAGACVSAGAGQWWSGGWTVRRVGLAQHLSRQLSVLTGVPHRVALVRVRQDWQDARYFAEEIARLLERRVSWFRLRHRVIHSLATRQAGRIRGLRVVCAGRVGGGRSKKAQRSRVLSVRWGRTPLATLSAPMDYASATAITAQGAVGIKVWLATGLSNSLAKGYSLLPKAVRARVQRGSSPSMIKRSLGGGAGVRTAAGVARGGGRAAAAPVSARHPSARVTGLGGPWTSEGVMPVRASWSSPRSPAKARRSPGSVRSPGTWRRPVATVRPRDRAYT